jgi:hypothetical protein
MATKIENQLGLNNVLNRLAYHYFVTKGLGEHPVDHHIYDEVEVSALYDWMPDPTADPDEDADYQGAIKVTFLRSGVRIRWTEFSIRCIGGGGEPIVQRIK